MTERLKQIWGGFQETTTRSLTGRGIENIVVPHRADYNAIDEAHLPEDFEAPAQAAFEALHHKLAAQEKRFGRKKSKTNQAAAAAPLAMADYDGGAGLLKGLRSTAMRTERGELDYVGYLTTDEGKAFSRLKKRRKFLGIF